MLYPCAGNNSIQSVAVVAEWETELTPDAIKTIKSRIDPIVLPLLPNVQIQRVFQLNVGPVTTHTDSDYGGLVYEQKSTDNKGKTSLILNQQSIIFSIGDYTRWDAFKTQITDQLLRVIDVLLDTLKIRSLNLQYVDLFEWRDSIENFDSTQVFSPDNSYLPKHIFTMNNFWHSHNGFLARHKDFQKLDNVNVNIIDSSGVKVQVITSHKLILDNTLEKVNFQDLFMPYLDILHADNKTLLNNLFSEKVLKDIGLNK